MIKIGGSYRLLIILVTVFFYFQLFNTVFAQYEYDSIILYQYDYDPNKCSYHFSAKSYGSLSDGEFYFTDGKLWANNVGQQGLIDLGVSDVSVQFDPKTIDIPSIGFNRFGVEAKSQNVYLTQARAGEDNRYILFRINYLSLEGKAAGLEYYILETGTIIVRTNIEGKFSIQGPRMYTAEGMSWQKERTLTGEYTIIFEPVSGYKTPSSQTKLLNRGSTVVFEANYEPTYIQTPTPATPTPPPIPTSTPIPNPTSTPKPLIDTQIVVAIIAAFSAIITAYLGYLAVVKKK